MRLGISGGKFTLNGAQTFLLVESYFDGIHARVADLDAFVERGFHGLRVFLDWVDFATETPTRSGVWSFFNSDGTLKAAKSDLLAFIQACDARGLIVELVVLNGSSDGWMTTGTARTAAVTNALTYFGDEPNVLFDLINEAEQCAYITSFSDITAFVTTARTAKSTAILTVSVAPATLGGDGPLLNSTTDVLDTSYATSYMGTGVDVLAFHPDGNSVDWWNRKDTRIANIRTWLDANGYQNVPIYINEDNRWGTGYSGGGEGDIEADYYLITALETKQYGGAGWCHHSDASFDLTGSAHFRTLYANADEQDAYDRLGAWLMANGQSRITFDAHTESAVGSAVSTRTFNHTIGAGLKNGCLVVGTGARGNSAANLVVASVTCGGIALTKQREDLTGDLGGGEYAGTSLWTLVNPPAGAQSIVVTWTGSISNIVTAFATSRARVNQQNPVHAVAGAFANGSSSAIRALVTSREPYSLIVDSEYNGDDPAQAVGPAQTVRSNRVVTGVSTDNVGSSEQPAPRPCTTPMSWIPVNPTFWVLSALALTSDGLDYGKTWKRNLRPRPFCPGIAR